MFTPKCTHKSCGWVGLPKKTKALMEQALQMHVGRIHTKKIRTPSGPRPLKVEAHANGHANGNGNVVTELKTILPSKSRTAHALAEPSAPKPKRKYTKRVHTQPHPVISDEVQINYCYGCGAPQKHLSEGTLIAKLMDNDPVIRRKIQAIIAHV